MKKSRSKDGLTPHCKLCQKLYKKRFYNEHYDLKIIIRREYRVDIKKIDYNKRKKELVLNFKIACNLRTRNYKAFRSQNFRKTNKTIDLLGCSHSFFQRWIIHQQYGKIFFDNYGSVWQIDHCLPISSFDLLDVNDLKKCFNWINFRPMYFIDNNSKKSKIDPYLYILQEITVKYFLKLNEERLNKDFHR